MFNVTRQCQWPEGTLMVEVCAGSLDYANPGMLTPRFASLGEGCEFSDPREAVNAAVQIRDAWKREQEAGAEILLGYGATGGMTMPFDACSDEDARAWADDAWEKLPKCDHCGEALGAPRDRYRLLDGDGEFCSDSCAEACAEYDSEYAHSFRDDGL